MQFKMKYLFQNVVTQKILLKYFYFEIATLNDMFQYENIIINDIILEKQATLWEIEEKWKDEDILVEQIKIF